MIHFYSISCHWILLKRRALKGGRIKKKPKWHVNKKTNTHLTRLDIEAPVGMFLLHNPVRRKKKKKKRRAAIRDEQ